MDPSQTHQMSMRDLFSLEGKTAIVTGATGGLGYTMSCALAELGADIVSVSIPNDPLYPKLEEKITGFGRKCASYGVDVGNSPALRQCFAKIWEDGHVPDILVTCAGLNRRASILDQTDEKIDLIWSVNLKGTYVSAQEVAKRLVALNKTGKIITIGSATSFCAMTNTSPYATSKAGVLQMTKAFSNELAGKGIQCNCICPGYIETPLTLLHQKQFPELKDYINNRTPSGRWGQPADLRGTVAFLASPASDFVTGTHIIVDGGLLSR